MRAQVTLTRNLFIREFKDSKIDAVKRVATDVSQLLPSSGYKTIPLKSPDFLINHAAQYFNRYH